MLEQKDESMHSPSLDMEWKTSRSKTNPALLRSDLKDALVSDKFQEVVNLIQECRENKVKLSKNFLFETVFGNPTKRSNNPFSQIPLLDYLVEHCSAETLYTVIEEISREENITETKEEEKENVSNKLKDILKDAGRQDDTAILSVLYEFDFIQLKANTEDEKELINSLEKSYQIISTKVATTKAHHQTHGSSDPEPTPKRSLAFKVGRVIRQILSAIFYIITLPFYLIFWAAKGIWAGLKWMWNGIGKLSSDAESRQASFDGSITPSPNTYVPNLSPEDLKRIEKTAREQQKAGNLASSNTSNKKKQITTDTNEQLAQHISGNKSLQDYRHDNFDDEESSGTKNRNKP